VRRTPNRFPAEGAHNPSPIRELARSVRALDSGHRGGVSRRAMTGREGFGDSPWG
jgi:hypothetical protein